MKILALLALLGTAAHGQVHGMTGLGGSHPRIYWNVGSRLTNAQAYFALHPWTPGADTIDNAGVRAAYSLIAVDPTACTVAHDRVMAFTIDTGYFTLRAGAATDGGDDVMRHYADIVVEVWDWCQSDFSAGDTRLLLDRWIGTTSNASDPIHTFTDGAVGANSLVLTSASNPFLANMAVNNMVIFTSGGGANCPPVNSYGGFETRYGIVSVDSPGQVTLFGYSNSDPTISYPSSVNATGCHGKILGYVGITDENDWGRAAMPFSNYSGAFTRDDLIYGVGTYAAHAYAPTLLNNWETRFAQAVAYQAGTTPFTGSSGLGGFIPEGVEYGIQNWFYQFWSLIIARDYGRDLLLESTWYRASIFSTIYNAMLTPTWDQVSRFYNQFLPWDDQQRSQVDDDTPGYPHGNLAQQAVSELANILGSSKVAQYGRKFVDTLTGTAGLMPQPWLVDPLSTTLSLTGLPLDFCVAGTGTCWFKNSWAASGTQFKSYGATDLTGHMHFNPGDWWLVSNAYRMSAGFSAYADDDVFKCIGSGYDPGVDTCSVRSSLGHNTVSFATSTAPSPCNVGIAIQGNATGGDSPPPVTLRLASQANYAYIAEDISANYYNGEIFGTTRACQQNNPYQKTTVRQKLFIKPLSIAVILDRLESQFAPTMVDTDHLVQTAAQVLKVVYVHAPVTPTIASNVAVWDNNSVQRMKVWAFTSESGVTLNDVDEGDFTGSHPTYPYPHRLEISANGTAQTYMITVIRTAPISGWADPTSITYNNSTHTLDYQSAAGNFIFTFGTGSQPTGETFGYSASGAPTPVALTSTAVFPVVTDNGPEWPGGGSNGGTVRGGKTTTGGKIQ